MIAIWICIGILSVFTLLNLFISMDLVNEIQKVRRYNKEEL